MIEGGRAADLSFFIGQAPRGDEAAARFQLMEAVIGNGGRQIFMGFVDSELLRGELSQPQPTCRSRPRTDRPGQGRRDDPDPRARERI